MKPLLYVYRVLLTGIHLMKTGVLEAILGVLNEQFRLPFIDELMARKIGGAEKETLDGEDLELHQREFDRLLAELETSYEQSKLPNEPRGAADLHDLLLRIRLEGKGN